MTPMHFDSIPSELRNLPRWLCWRKVNRDGRQTKVPVDPRTRHNAAADDPATWGAFDAALAALDRDSTLAGLGFMFNGDGLLGVDLDHALDAAGNLDPAAAGIVESLGTYTERSQSGTGLHMICRAALPAGKGRRKGNVELYATGRFFVMTGDRWPGTPATIEPRQGAIDDMLKSLFPPVMKAAPRDAAGPVHLGDRELVERASAAKNGAKFFALWRGDWQGAGHTSQSEADAALLGMLRFWTGGDRARAFALFSQSGLNREKWGRADYRESTWATIDSGEVFNPGTDVFLKKCLKLVEPDGPEPWAPPIGFDAPVNLPPFPIEVLPEPFQAFVSDVAASKQVPPDLPGALALGAVSLAGAKRWRVYIGRSHIEPVNLFLLALMDPGSRKSDTFRACLSPVEDFEIELARAAAPEIARARERLAVEESRLTELHKRAGRCDDPEKRRALTLEAETLAASLTAIPHPPRLLAGDISPEHLATLLCANGGRMAVADAEGALVFEIMGGKYSKSGNPNIEIFLKGHAGDAVRVDRTGRAPDFSRAAALTCILTAQPSILKGLTGKDVLRGRGLLARFLFTMPAGMIGERAYTNRPMDPELVGAYAARLRDLLAVEPLDPQNPEAHRRLALDGEALEVWRTYHDRIETAQGPDGDLSHMTDFASKLAGAVARMAGILHLMRHGPDAPPAIEPATAAGAWALGLYFLDHTKAAFAEIGQGGDLGLARRVYGWIIRNRPERFTLGRLFNDLRRGDDITQSAALLPAMDILEDRNIARREPDKHKSGPGRKSFGTWQVNPAILAGTA